jgi:hypothetical protein
MPTCDDPIECGHEAAIGQWEARWYALRYTLRLHPHLASTAALMDRVAAELPVGKPAGPRKVAEALGFEPDNHHNALVCPYCCTPDRINIQLEPARVSRLVEVLRSAGAHPSGLGSYPAANDANALADDIANMAQRQPGWRT